MLAYFAAAALCVASVDAHGYMLSPLGRSQTIPGHSRAREPQSDGMAFRDCLDGGQVGPVQVTWQEGQDIEVDVVITAFHRAGTNSGFVKTVFLTEFLLTSSYCTSISY
jgi:hypothetical protein